MNQTRHILTPRRKRPYWRQLALLVMVLLAVLESVAHADPKWGLDRMLSKAAPGLAKKMKDKRAGTNASVDMGMGYPNYTYQGPVAQMRQRMLAAAAAANANALLNRGPKPGTPNANAGNPFAPRQASVAPASATRGTVLGAPTFAPRSTETSQAADLLAEANAVEAQLQRQENLRASRDQRRAAFQQMNAIPESYAPTGQAANRLLASLQKGPSENTYRAEALRRAEQDAVYVAQQRNLRAREAASGEIYPLAARGDADPGAQVSKAMRGGGVQTSPVKLESFQVFVSDGYLNRHSPASQQDSGDEPGGVRHLRHTSSGAPALGGGTSGNPFNNSSRKAPASAETSESGAALYLE